MSESTPQPAATAPPAASAPRPSSRFARLARGFWPVLSLFLVGVLVSERVLRKPPAPPGEGESPPVAESTPPSAEKPPEPPPEKKSDLRRGDDLLREVRYEEALALLEPLATAAESVGRGNLHYRLGVANEGLGRWAPALAAYRTVVARAPASYLAVAAQLGQARVWLHQRRAREAKALLAPLTLRAADPGLRAGPFLAEVHYLRALVLAQEVLPVRQAGPASAAPLSHDLLRESLAYALAWAEGPPETLANVPLAEVLRVRPTGLAAEVTGVAPASSVASLVDGLARQAGLASHGSPRALEAAREQSAWLHLDAAPLVDVVRALAEPLGLTATIDARGVHLAAENELDPAALAAYRSASARRALTEALVAHPAHRLTPLAQLELANLDATEGKVKAAIAGYEAVARGAPRSAAVLEASYNLGLVRRARGDRAEARAAFFRVVDRAPGHELTPLSYLWIGRLYLEDGDAARAIAPLKRATSATAGDVLAASVVTLAAAQLLGEEPVAANGLLREYRERLTEEPYRSLAVFLDALARFRAGGKRQREAEGPELLTAAVALPTEDVLGPVGALLLGQAYRDLGVAESMAAVYRQALRPEMRGPLATEMRHGLAEYHFALDDRAEARRLYTGLSSGPRAATALLRLAELDLRDKDAEACVTRLRKGLHGGAALDMEGALRLLGRAYEALGDHARAARCYAGKLPEGS